MASALVVEFETLTVDATGTCHHRQAGTNQTLVETVGEAAFSLVAIAGGQLLMGAPQTEEGWHPNQGPVHTVAIAPFWMSQYPVTQAQWRVVAALPPVKCALPEAPACFSGDKRPVEQVAWAEAVEFCDRLSRVTQRRYRLPSEAEWEYACRAMVAAEAPTLPFHFGATITTDLANYSGVDWEFNGKVCNKGAYGQGPTGCDRRETTEVGSFGVANAFGLYDMHGLVREWCADCWHDSYAGAPTDGRVWIEGGNCQQRVLRGGSWNGGPRTCRSAFRSKANCDSHLYDIGFRIVCDG